MKRRTDSASRRSCIAVEPDQVGKDDRDDLARDGRVVDETRRDCWTGTADERGATGIAEPGVRPALSGARRAARRERFPAAVAEPGPGPVRSPAAGAIHGDDPREYE